MTPELNFIDGKLVDCKGCNTIPVTNPSTDEVIGEIYETPKGEVDRAVAAAKKAQPAWEKLPAIERAKFLKQIAQKVREHADEVANILVREQGKTQALAKVEANFTADYMDYMAGWARRIEGEIIPSDRPGETILLMRQAIGVVGGILPWNFPFFLIARKMAPALLVGNTIVIKPSVETPLNASIFAKIVANTDLPKGVFNMVFGRGSTTGQNICENPDVGLVSFTGSVDTGVRIMSAAAKNITKVNLELGGKAPAIVAKDADLDLAVRAILASRVINTGQVCNCAERVYVDRAIEAEFLERMSKAMKAVRYGNPEKMADADMGPLINKAALSSVSGFVDIALKEGAECLVGGEPADIKQGNFYQPTLLAHCKQNMEIVQKEVFGPVLPVVAFDTIDDAIEMANDTIYGLTSSIYTKDLSTAMRASNELRFGETYINRENFEAMQGFHAGTKKSGIGGADGKHGILEYTHTHVVYIQN
ncbi:aldehyde dehydrogenase [Bartonella sp. M0283]|uniref:aldehyde dehydrogenase n=1 Tax=Bartonella sp. M0283 TaxID=2751016 RepID=UPI0018DCC39C|nr:aldehyde dehydrogenase [Bartonella sp. M0283]MBI0163305.1 aldehyde dehydrogenase [Bartonella sp. M0283]